MASNGSSHEETLLAYIRQHPNGVMSGKLDADMSHIPDMQRVNAINLLIRRGLIEVLRHQDTCAYRAVREDILGKQASLDSDEKLVYQAIASAGNKGIWVKKIREGTNLKQQAITRCLKALEQKNLIKSVKSVEHPTKKLYMLSELNPSAEITGGPWFTDLELDVEFIEELSKQCYGFILSRSFPRQAQHAVYSTSYTGYPTAREVCKYITDRQISNVPLGIEDIQCLLDILVLDGKIERRNGFGLNYTDDEYMGAGGDVVYKAVRDTSSKGNALTETPCGKCPVFSFCTKDGPISPDNCVYYTKWLQF